MGEEKATVIALMRKYVAYLSTEEVSHLLKLCAHFQVQIVACINSFSRSKSSR